MTAQPHRLRPQRRTLAIAAAMACGATAWPPCYAATLLPGAEVTPVGTQLSSRPELGGLVVADTLRPFAVPDGGKGYVRGVLQDRVVRSRETGTLIFSQRLMMESTTSTLAQPAEWVRTGLAAVTVDADYARDGLGTLAAASSQRSADGSKLRFKLVRPVAPGESTNFHQALTNALGFDAGGTVTIQGPGMPAPVVLPAYRPTGTPQPNYTVTTIGASPTWPFLNDHGQVSITLGSARSGTKAAIWQPVSANDIDGDLSPLPILPGYLFSAGAHINNRGQVAGTSFTLPVDPAAPADPRQRAFVFTPFMANTSSGSVSDLGILPGGTFSNARGINDSGQVTGSADYAGAPGPTAAGLRYDAPVLWTGGAPHMLGAVGSFGAGRSINNAGEIAGFASLAAGTYQGFVWKPSAPGAATGSFTPVYAVGGASYRGSSAASDINAAGVAVGGGRYFDAGGAYAGDHGWLLSTTRLTDIGQANVLLGINDAGLVVGNTQTTVGALFRSGRPTKLGYLASPAQAWSLMDMTDINASGQIVGFGGTATVPRSVVLLTPVRIQSVSACPATAAAFTLVVNGTGFVPGAVVRWNGAALPTTRVSSRLLKAEVPAAAATPGRRAVLVTQPDGTQSSVAYAC